MSRFHRAFLQERLNGRVHVAAFGKHPAWDDHIEDLDLPTTSLVIAKQLLYSGGIAQQLASGDWDRLESSGRAIQFEHRFVWGRGRHSLFGAIWSSADAKGRSRFPMIACVQAEVGSLLATRLYLEPIEKFAAQCRTADTKEAVANLLNQINRELNSPEFAARFTPDPRPSSTSAQDTASVLSSLLVAAEAVDQANGNLDQPKGWHCRVPLVSTSLRENIRFWSGYLERKSIAPGLTIADAPGRLMDLVLGEPKPSDFFCLRAGIETLPLTQPSDELKGNRKFRSEADDFLRAWRRGTSAVWKPGDSWWQSIFKNSNRSRNAD